MSNVQYVNDDSGNPKFVVVSIAEWKRISEYVEKVQAREQVLDRIRQGLLEVRYIEAGKIKPMAMEELLNEL